MSICVSDHGIVGEVVSMPKRANGKSRESADYHPGDTPPTDRKLIQLADTWDCAPEDLLFISERGLIGKPSPVAAVRIGQMALRLGKACAWTLADCVVLMRGAAKQGEEDKTVVSYDAIGKKLGISGDRAEKYARMAKAFATEERRPDLDFTLHEEVAALNPAARETVLNRAIAEQMPCSKVRELVKQMKPVSGRNNEGRKPRSARTPVGPSAETVPSSVNGTAPVAPVAPVIETAPAGISHVNPSNQPGPMAPHFVLGDMDARTLLWNDCGWDKQASEAKLAEIVRAFYASGK